MKHLWVILLLAVAVPARAEKASGLPELAAVEVEELLGAGLAPLPPMFSLGPAVGSLQARLHFLKFLAVEGSPDEGGLPDQTVHPFGAHAGTGLDLFF